MIDNFELFNMINYKPKSYGDMLKEIRAKYNLTQTELANLIGVKQNQISQWEDSKHKPTVPMQFKIKKAYEKLMA